MKLTKISLATIVALGAFSSVATATPLEEAIKNVDLSGYARYRYNTVQVKDNHGNKDNETAGHQFKTEFSFKAALDDRFFGVLSLRYNKVDSSAYGADNNPDNTNTDGTFGVKEIYLGYKAGNTTLTAGKQVVGTFFTDDAVGTGLRLTNQDIEGLTLAAVVFDALEASEDETDGRLIGAYKEAYDENLYGVAAIGSYDPVSFQLWYASLVDTVNLIALDLATNIEVASDVNVGARAQYIHSDVDSDLSRAADANFYAAELSSEFFGADVAAGYIGYSVKDKLLSVVSLEDQGSLIDVGEIKSGRDYTLINGKGSFWYAKAGYTINSLVRVGAEYAKGDVKGVNNDKIKYDEWVARVSYAYSKKLNFSSFYAHETAKFDGGDKAKKSHFRFEAKYSF